MIRFKRLVSVIKGLGKSFLLQTSLNAAFKLSTDNGVPSTIISFKIIFSCLNARTQSFIPLLYSVLKKRQAIDLKELLFLSFVAKISDMKQEKVFWADTADYEKETVFKSVKYLFDSLGGAENVVGRNKRVFLKVNLVREMTPDKCGTTHPSVVEAISEILIKETGAEVRVGDSSGSAFNAAVMNATFKTCGMTDACAESGAVLIDDFGSTNKKIDGKVVRCLDIIDEFNDADVVINVGKLKTHSFTGYTGAVKNLYGLIPGLVKAQTHSLYPTLSVFCDCLIDIERFASEKIALHFIDAVKGMEGDGPTNGTPRFIGKIFAGTNPYFVDVAAVSLFADPLDMPLVKKACERGLLPSDLRETGIDLDGLSAQRISDFKTVRVVDGDFTKKGFLKRFLRKNWVTRRPVIDTKKCKGCGRCFAHCPRKAIDMVGKNAPKKAKIRKKDCIRCNCCQELCPHDAVRLKKPLLYRVICALSYGDKKKKTTKKP